MPELPEVETVARSLAPLIGRRILTAQFRGLRVLRGADPETMAACLRGRRITGVERYGKFILVALGGGGYLVIHLGMTGRLLLGGPAGKHTHAILTLDRGAVLLYDDSRQFGLLEYSREFPERFKKLGPEPLEVTVEEFRAALRRRKTRIKALLLNQGFLRGLGNIYADESLFRAGIRPRRQAASLSREELRRLHGQIRKVLREAITAGGSSISDYFDVAGEPGLFQTRHRVYGRTGEPCLTCGSPIQRVVVAGRSTHYCARCQK